MSRSLDKNDTQNASIKAVDQTTITVLLNGEEKKIRNDFTELKRFLAANQKEVIQTGDKIYNIGEIGQADFQNITNQYFSESKSSRRLQIFLTVFVPVLAVTLAFVIYKYLESQKPLSLTAKISEVIKNNELPPPKGKITLSFGTESFTKDLITDGVVFSEIPSSYRNKKAQLQVEAQGYVAIDTFIYLPNPLIELRLARNNDLAILKGRIKDGFDEDLEGVSVSITDFDLHAKTNSEGEFTIYIPAEFQRLRQRITVMKEGYRNKEITTPVLPNETLRLILESK